MSDQFQYSWRIVEGEGMGMYFASFRMAFAVLAFTSDDASRLVVRGHEERVVTPLEVGQLLQDIRASA